MTDKCSAPCCADGMATMCFVIAFAAKLSSATRSTRPSPDNMYSVSAMVLVVNTLLAHGCFGHRCIQANLVPILGLAKITPPMKADASEIEKIVKHNRSRGFTYSAEAHSLPGH